MLVREKVQVSMHTSKGKRHVLCDTASNSSQA